MENNKKSVFETLNAINVNDMVEKKKTEKSTLTYLSWSSAWQVVKNEFPDVEYEILRNPETNLPYWYDPLTGYMVFTKVTIDNQTHSMWLPVMDGTNHAMKAEPYQVQTKYKKFTVPAATMCDINKAIMRCLVKNLSMFGLGLYIYRSKDLPDGESQAQNTAQAQPANEPVEKAVPQAPAQQKPVKDTRPVTPQMVDFIRKTLEEHQVTTDFICQKYRVSELNNLKVYQAKHIGKNIDKLKTMFDNEKKEYLADIVKNAKPAKMETTFGDAICPPQQPQQEKNESEEVTLESLGLTEADLNILAEAGNIFS